MVAFNSHWSWYYVCVTLIWIPYCWYKLGRSLWLIMNQTPHTQTPFNEDEYYYQISSQEMYCKEVTYEYQPRWLISLLYSILEVLFLTSLLVLTPRYCWLNQGSKVLLHQWRCTTSSNLRRSFVHRWEIINVSVRPTSIFSLGFKQQPSAQCACFSKP